MGFRSGVVNGEVNDGNAYHRSAGVSLNAGLFGTARAVTEIGRAWLSRDARFLDERWIDEALGAPSAAGERRYALGWTREPADGGGMFGESSATGCSLHVDPDPRRVYVLLTNRLHPEARGPGMDDLRRRFHEAAAAL
jgi:CubicO group peptidase (beta-lactamase class C family)